MSVRSAKQHRRTQTHPHDDARAANAGPPEGRTDEVVVLASVVEDSEAREAPEAPQGKGRVAAGAQELSHEARVRQLREALSRFRAAFHDVRAAAVSLGRAEVQAFSRRTRRLSSR